MAKFTSREYDGEPGETVEYEGNYAKFVRVAEREGWRWRTYRGRFFYNGPAISTDESGMGEGPDLQEVIGAMSRAKIKVQWDNLGLDYIVYPR